MGERDETATEGLTMTTIEITVSSDLSSIGDNATSVDLTSWVRHVEHYISERHEGAEVNVVRGEQTRVRAWDDARADDVDGGSHALVDEVRGEVDDAWQSWCRERASS